MAPEWTQRSNVGTCEDLADAVTLGGGAGRYRPDSSVRIWTPHEDDVERLAQRHIVDELT
jgi:hypothetical protein